MSTTQLTSRLNLKGQFVRAGFWYLDMVRELEADMAKWQNAADKLKEKNPLSPNIEKYYAQARAIDSQINRVIKFYNLCEAIIDKYDSEQWLLEKTNELLLLQSAAAKQGKNIDVLGGAMALLSPKAKNQEVNKCL